MSQSSGLPQPIQESLQVIGKLIKHARKEAGITMTALAQRAGIERKTVTRLEKGDPSVGLGIFITIIWLLDIPLLNGIDLGRRQSRKQLSMLLDSLAGSQRQRKTRRNIDDNF